MEVFGIFNILNAVLMSTNIVLFFGYFLGYKFRNNKSAAIITGVIFLAIITLINIFIKEPIDAYDYTSLACLLLYFYPYFLFVPYKKKTFFFASLAINAIIDYLQYVFEAFLDGSKISIIISSCIYCIIYLLVISTFVILRNIVGIKVPEHYFDNLPVTVLISFFFVEFSAFYAGEFTKDGLANSKSLSLVLNVISAGLVCFSLIYMIYIYTKSSIEKEKTEMQLLMELKLYEKTIQNNEALSKFRHDYKNNLFSLKTFMHSQRYVEALEYVEDLTESLDAVKPAYSSGNYLADAILTDKSEKASAKGIRLDFFGSIPSDKIKNCDLCAVLSNSLDNAIRASESVENAVITVEGTENKQVAIIKISNPISEKVKIVDNEINTTKSNKKNHGYGIHIMKKVAEKYNGSAVLSCDEKVFSIKIGFVFDSEVQA